MSLNNNLNNFLEKDEILEPINLSIKSNCNSLKNTLKICRKRKHTFHDPQIIKRAKYDDYKYGSSVSIIA